MTEERILGAIESEGLIPSTQSLADYLQSHRPMPEARREPELAAAQG
jgi:hypothetical protein